MGTHEPDKLLQLWQRHEIDTEMAIGHILQNLLAQHQTLLKLNTSVANLQKEFENFAQLGNQPVSIKTVKNAKRPI